MLFESPFWASLGADRTYLESVVVVQRFGDVVNGNEAVCGCTDEPPAAVQLYLR